MGTVLLVVGVVSGALLIGALIGLYLPLKPRVEGFIVALAGGALLLSCVTELIQPTIADSSTMTAVLGVAAGSVLFTVIDYLIDEKWGSQSGGGMLAAVTVDGIPENLALGVALIGAGGKEVAALAAAILLSNLPEAASGARAMREDAEFSNRRALAVWAATAAILSLAAVGGWAFLQGLDDNSLGFIRCVAAGAVIASLATEVFPQAFKESRHMTGIATAIGVLMALLLSQLG